MSKTAEGGGRPAPEAARSGVLLLGALDGAPVPAAEHLHKMAYHLSGWLPDLEAAARFEASDAGPRSPEVGEAAASLEADGLAARGPGGWALTGAGRALHGEPFDGREEALAAADAVKLDHNSMTGDEILAMSHFTHDESVPCARSGPEHDRLSGIRRELADAMHVSGRLGISMSACIAGAPLQDYTEAAHRRGWVSDIEGPP